MKQSEFDKLEEVVIKTYAKTKMATTRNDTLIRLGKSEEDILDAITMVKNLARQFDMLEEEE